MSIIMLNSQPYSGGKDIAIMLSAKIGYKNIGEEIYELTARHYNVPINKIKNALYDAPSLFSMMWQKRQKYIIYYHATLLSQLVQDNLIYYGYPGHILVQGISHVLKVYISADITDRARRKSNTEGTSDTYALKELVREDKKHKQLLHIYLNADDTNPAHYDMVLNTSQMTMEDAANYIAESVANKRFQSMTYSTGLVKKLDLTFRIKAAIIHIDANIDVKIEEDNVIINTKVSREKEKEKRAMLIQEILKNFEEIKTCDIVTEVDYFSSLSSSLR
ncbi:MAG: cytidylate kinase-like family protein [Candidatus Magnetoovum sp. WYHC-5]|nr:cytidylate kinase-like family protein [Candidatus Magnetoovum sp. WYHC-5]